MKITPKTEKEIQESLMLQPGVYNFEVISASEEISKSGNEMLVLKLRIFSDEGNRVLTDYLLDAVAYKIRHFAESIGMIEDYEAGSIDPADLPGKCGEVMIGIQKDKLGQYPDKSSVKDYVVPVEASAPRAGNGAAFASVTAPVTLESDDIPF